MPVCEIYHLQPSVIAQISVIYKKNLQFTKLKSASDLITYFWSSICSLCLSEDVTIEVYFLKNIFYSVAQYTMTDCVILSFLY